MVNASSCDMHDAREWVRIGRLAVKKKGFGIIHKLRLNVYEHMKAKTFRGGSWLLTRRETVTLHTETRSGKSENQRREEVRCRHEPVQRGLLKEQRLRGGFHAETSVKHSERESGNHNTRKLSSPGGGLRVQGGGAANVC